MNILQLSLYNVIAAAINVLQGQKALSNAVHRFGTSNFRNTQTIRTTWWTHFFKKNISHFTWIDWKLSYWIYIILILWRTVEHDIITVEHDIIITYLIQLSFNMCESSFVKLIKEKRIWILLIIIYFQSLSSQFLITILLILL